MMENPKISVIVPVFNEAENLPLLLPELTAALEPFDYEVIFVDDGSSDGSAAVIKTAREGNRRIRLVQFSDNFGQHAALIAGYQVARGGIIVTMDADMQNDPANIPRFIEKIEKEGNDAVFGWRVNRENSLFLRQLPSRVFNALRNRFLQRPLHDYGCALNAFRRRFVDELSESPDHLKHITTYIASRRVKYEEVQIEERRRHSGKSRYSHMRLLQLAVELLITGSNKPVATFLLMFTAALAGLFTLGFGAAAVHAVAGGRGYAVEFVFFAFMSFVAGIVSGVLALVNEKISSLLRLSHKKPPYIIKEHLD